MSNKYILNTIAFKSQLDKHVPQYEFVKSVKDAGFDAIEIRNEFLSGKDSELREIASRAKQSGLDVYYSINDTLIDGDRVTANFEKYVHEMHLLGSSKFKMNIGDLTQMTSSRLEKGLENKIPEGASLRLENNQTVADSSLDTTRAFFQLVHATNLHGIEYCFDIANWDWLGEDANVAADSLMPETTYLHLKNVELVHGVRRVVPLEQGMIDWRPLLRRFINAHDFGFEYEGSMEVISSELKKLKSQLSD